MIIETQDGEIVDIHEITLQGNEISCKDPEDKRRKKDSRHIFRQAQSDTNICGNSLCELE